MKKIMLIISLSIFLITLTSCWDKKIYEKTGFILNVGLETGDKDKLLITYTVPVVGIEKKGEVEAIVSEGSSLRESREEGRRISPKNLEGGKTQHILISKEIAEKGVGNLLEVFQREPVNPILAIIVVVEGSAIELIEKTLNFDDKPRSAFYIHQLLENNINNGYIPETRIYNFDLLYFAPGVDPITPMLKLEPNGVRVSGSAMFSGDKMVGSIDADKTVLLLSLMNKKKVYTYLASPYEIDGEESSEKEYDISVLLKDIKRKINIEIKEDRPVVDAFLKFDVILDSFMWDKIDIREKQKRVEEHIAKEMKREYANLIEYLQEIGSDPIGIGDMIRANHNSYWRSIEWADIYKNLEVNIDVEVDIKQYGVIK